MLLSSLGLRRHKPRLFRSKRPVNRALGFCHSLGFDGSSAPYGNACVERDRPFPHVPSNALNDAILDAAIFHVVKNRSGVFASGMSILPRSSSKRMPPKTSSMYSISRALCSDGMRCIKPLASSRNETNSLRVNVGATGPFSEYAPQVAGIKRLPAYTCQLSGFGFCGGWCLGSPPGERRISGLR